MAWAIDVAITRTYSRTSDHPRVQRSIQSRCSAHLFRRAAGRWIMQIREPPRLPQGSHSFQAAQKAYSRGEAGVCLKLYGEIEAPLAESKLRYELRNVNYEFRFAYSRARDYVKISARYSLFILFTRRVSLPHNLPIIRSIIG